MRNASRPTGVVAVAVVLLFASAGTLLAQRYTEGLDVRVIQVPVVVSRNAKPVEGLKREDFEVFVNGERQPIAYFDVIEFKTDGATPRPDLPAPAAGTRAASADLSQRRLTLLVFDIANSTFAQLSRARADVEKFIAALAPDDLVSIAIYTGDAQARYVVPFTKDRPTVQRAIATLRRSRSGDALGLTMTQDERDRVMVHAALSPSTGKVEQQFTDDLITGMDDFESTIAALQGGESQVPSVLDSMRKVKEWQDQTTIEMWGQALGSLAEDLTPLEGIKQVLLLTEGRVVGDVGDVTFGNIAARMHQRFKDAGVTLNVIDIAGLRAPAGDVGQQSAGPDSRTPNVLYTAALGTGGRVIADAGVSTALKVFSESRSITYMLGLKPPANEKDANDIVVKVRNQGPFTEVSYRRGYAKKNPEQREVSGLLLADAMLNSIRRNDVTVKLQVDEKSAPVVVDVGMPSNELLAHAFGGQVTVDVFVYVFDDANRAVEWKHRRTRLNAAQARQVLRGGELVRRERFSLTPGRYTVKTLVHVLGRDLLGFDERIVNVSRQQASR